MRPRSMGDLVEDLAQRLGRPVPEEEVLIWLALGAAAQREGRALLRPVVHAFAVRLQAASARSPSNDANSHAHGRWQFTSRAAPAAALLSKRLSRRISISPARMAVFYASISSRAGIQDQDPVPGDERIPTIRNFKFSNIRVTGCPVLVDGTAVHPDKPLDFFSLIDVTGTRAKGISLANIRHADIRDVKVTGYSAPLIGINNVTGEGLEGAATIEPPKIPEAVKAPATPYRLRLH